ncbi:hypothetical protein ACG7TL_002214 [Trametes sanguinea]
MPNATEAASEAPEGLTVADNESSGGFKEAIVIACEAVVERFRRQEISKADAAVQLFRALKLDEVVEADELEERIRAYKSYFDMLEDVDREQRVAAGHSPEFASSQTQESPRNTFHRGIPDVQRQGGAGVTGEELGAGEDRRSLLDRLSDAPPSKRRREGDDSDNDSSEDDKRARRKRAINESLFPFVSSASEEVSQLSDDLQRTLILKENYTRDLAVAKQRVVCSPGCPPIPDSVWPDILANRFVDLDRIFSAVYTIDGDGKSSIKLGDYELSGLPTKPKKHIERHGHWTIAWALYQRAVLFVYPHRERELRAYYDQINGFFAAVSEHEAIRVVNLDRAIRGEVGRSNTILLSDFARFNHLYTMHVVGAGAATQSSALTSMPSRKTTASRRPGPSSEASVDIVISAPPAPVATTSPVLARKRQREDPSPIVANKRPRRFRGFLWSSDPSAPVTPLATLSETMNALPAPPVLDPQYAPAWETIRNHPHFFRVVSPLKVDVFEQLLESHPNRPLVESVCRGFREGFWPFADPALSDLPDCWEENSGPMDGDALEFALQYTAEEEQAGRYSEPFYGDLLPGMFSMPIHAVPKPHSDKLRFINNHSAGKFSLNSMIDKRAVGMRPDNVQDLAHNLLQFRAIHGDSPLWLFKSDIANAYRILPMHPLWQLKQVVSIHGTRRIDRCCCFGNRGSPDLFCTFMALLLWIAIHVRDVPCLLAYMDDNFTFEASPTLEKYMGYGEPVMLPYAQTRLLQLWDDVGVPHAAAKQLFGRSLTITGFLVDSDAMTITLPPDACADLVAAIHAFLTDASRRRRPLRDWQRLVGWINWGLNVQPLLRPALQSSYAKIAGRTIPHAPIYINARVTRDLLFIASVFQRYGGVHMLKASAWGPDAADLVVLCDACLAGMAFWIPALSVAFVADCPPAPPGLDDNIFWYEALTVLAALEWVKNYVEQPPSRLAIFTDNLNTVQMFESFRANVHFDDILLRACDMLIASGIDLRVWHIAGQQNTVADALSRGLFHVALQYAPHLTISTQPPREAWTYDRLVRERAIALGYAIDKSTRLAYTSHLQSYLTFCKIHGFPIDPSVDTLSFFVVYMCHHIKPDSVDSYLSGICNQLESLYPDVRSNRRSPLVSRTLKGCKRLYNSPPNRKLPLSIEHLLQLLEAFPDSSYDNSLFRAILICGFFGLHRLGELVQPDHEHLRNWRKAIKRSSVRVFGDNFSYILPTHKADPTHRGHQVIISTDHPDVNPLLIFTRYLTSRDRQFRFLPALWLTSDGHIPTRNWFISRLRRVLPLPTTAEPFVLDSEEEVDATLDHPSESSSASLFDCSGLPHLFDWEEHTDRHLRPTTSKYEECDDFPCPHRYDQPGNPSSRTTRTWAEYPNQAQESPLYPFSESVFDLFSSPTPIAAPTPVVVSRSPSPAAPLQFASTTPPISLDFSDDFRDSPQFFLLTMGDIKPDTIPLLTSASQYSDWVAKIKGVMLFTGCWGPILSQSAPEGEKAEDWKKKDDQAKGLIWMRVATNYHYLLETKETTEGDIKKRVPASYSAKEMWDVLKKEFGTPDTAEAIGLLMAYFNLPPMSDSRPLRDQLGTYITRIRDASNGGMNFSEHQQAVFLLMKLPPSYNTLSTSLTASHKLGDWTVEWVQGKVLAEESLRSGTSQSVTRISKTKPKPSGPCDFCGSGTHHESTCWKKHPDQRPKKGGKGKGKGKEKKGKEKDNSNNHANAAAPAVNVLVAESSNMHASFYSAAHAAGVRHTHWLMDSGASQHITFDINDFAEYSAYDTPIVFRTAASGEGSSVKALGEGLVRGETFIDGVKWSIDLPKVCYIPMASSRLFSTGSIEKNGYSIFQGDKKMSIFDKLPSGAVSHGSTIKIEGRKILEGVFNPINNLYDFVLEIKSGGHVHLSKTDYKTWHRRFGHAGKEALRHLPKNVKGVDHVDPADDEPCEGCAYGKSHRLPFPPSEKRATEPLELVHTDLDGPMRTAAVGSGYLYFASFIDDFSGLGIAYYLKRKSDAMKAFDSFKAWAETQTGKKIKRVRSDRGGEYLSNEFTQHLLDLGIEHQKSTPDSPQQNGRAERWNRTIVEKAMSMLHHAGLSHGFWQLAVDAAVHIYNRQPMRRLKWRCPITAWDGTVPDVSYFRVFGCKAFVHVQKSKREGKLDKKAVEMIFVGYEPGTKGYKFWNPATRSIVVSRDVIFDEESFPARSIPGYRRVTPSDNPFPEHEGRSDDVSNSDSGDLPQIPIPLPLDEDRPPSPPPAPPAPEEDEEPQPPPQPPQQPPQPRRPAVPVPRPAHRRNRHEPVGGAEVPGLGNERPRRENWRPPARYREDNIFGDRDPVEVERQSTEDGDELEAQAIRFVLASQYKSGIPNSHREAMNSPDKDKWRVAEKAEYDSLMENKTWVLVPRPKDRQVVANRWVYDIKHDGRYKARLVAKGFTQVWGEDYHETFSPVARFESIRYLLAHTALEDWDIESMDVKTAFLNGDLEEEIYMEQPEGWVVRGKENYVCLLKKAIYGLKQASRQWNLKIHKSLLDLGFTRTYSDAGVYVYWRQGGEKVTIVVLYVDDLLLLGDDRQHIKQVKDALKKQYKMTDLGAVKRFLGLRISRDRTIRRIDIDQEEYIQSVIERFEMADCKPSRTPLPAGAVLESSEQPEPASDSFRQRYQSLIGSLLYAALGTRPDIDFAVNRLSKYNANPSDAHWHYAKYVLRYLQGTKHFRLRYDGASNDGLLVYSDSDWGEDRDNRRSTSGYVFLMAGGAISWASRRQPTVSLSSTEAEYLAASDTCRQIAWLRTFGTELGDDMLRPTPLCLDNQGSIFLGVNPVVERRTKHIDIRHHYIREQIELGKVEVFFVATKDQLADPLTKNVSFSLVEWFRKGVGLVDPTA